MDTPTTWSRSDIGDLSNMTAMITGANSGLGKVTARVLAESGAQVILACRNVESGEAAMRSIKSAAPAARLSVQALDLADLSSVSMASTQVAERHDRLDLLINNAGIMAVEQGDTVDGFERQFGTNHLGHFALTGHLMPLLRASSARVVALSSIAAQKGQLNFDDLHHRSDYDRWVVYRQSKLANLMFAFELAKWAERSSTPITSVAAHPGVSSTGLGKGLATGGFFERIQAAAFAVAGQSPEDGALPVLYAAVADIPPASFIGPDGIAEFRGKHPTAAKVPPQAHDAAAAKRLWEESEKLTAVQYG